jgi:hypothetical protein
MVDPRLLIPSEHPTNLFRDLPRAGGLGLEQPRKHLPQLRHGQRRRFFSKRRFSKTTTHSASSDRVM